MDTPLPVRLWGLGAFAAGAMVLLPPAPTANSSDEPAATRPAAAREAFGAEANPTGSPVGGGEGCKGLVARPERTVASAAALLAALKDARAGDVLYVDDRAEIDLTGQRDITIGGGVTLAGGRGRDGAAGALLFTTEDKRTPKGKAEAFCLFRTGGPNVRVTGLRLRGPAPLSKRYWQRKTYAYLNSRGICASHDGLEVDNCEIFAFSHAGIFARAGKGLRVHHNAIHHCRRLGLGYGVCIDRARVLIEANVFDWCRHAIAGTGRLPGGYEARYNLVGEHPVGVVFDMHGKRDRKDKGAGDAGNYVRIHHNTFRNRGAYVVIRGRPAGACEIHHNWFVHGDEPGSPVLLYPHLSRARVYRNQFGPDKVVK